MHQLSCGLLPRRFRLPGINFVVVSDHNLLPAILGRPGLPKTDLYKLTRTVSPQLPAADIERLQGSVASNLQPESAVLAPAQLFNPYGHDNLFTYLDHNVQEWKVVRKAFAKSMSAERIRCAIGPAPPRSMHSHACAGGSSSASALLVAR